MDLLAQYDSDASDTEPSSPPGNMGHDSTHVSSTTKESEPAPSSVEKAAHVSSNVEIVAHSSLSALPAGFFSAPPLEDIEPEHASKPSSNPAALLSQKPPSWSVSAPNLAPRTIADDAGRAHKSAQIVPESGSQSKLDIVGPSRPMPQVQDDDATNTSSSMFSALPAPKTAVKKVVKLKLPIQKALLKAIEEERADGKAEEERPAKRKKTSNSSSLIDMLPAPKNATSRTDLFSSLPAPGKRDNAPPTDVQGPAAPPPHNDTGYNTAYSNEMYRVEADIQRPRADAIPSTQSFPEAYPYAAPTEQAPPEAYTYPASVSNWDPAAGSGDTSAYQYEQAYGYSAADTWHTEIAQEDDLQQALEAEKERAARKGQALNVEDIQFVEINQAQLKHVDPASKEAHDALRNALGSEYALNLRAKATAFTGSKMARRKHQIGTLFHNAKMRELEMMENRAQAMKNKAETQGKYGW